MMEWIKKWMNGQGGDELLRILKLSVKSKRKNCSNDLNYEKQAPEEVIFHNKRLQQC